MRTSAPRNVAIGTALTALLVTGAGISAAGAQAAPVKYSITVTQAAPVKTAFVSTAAAASCRLNTITITRTSMCMDIGARVNLLQNGKPVGVGVLAYVQSQVRMNVQSKRPLEGLASWLEMMGRCLFVTSIRPAGLPSSTALTPRSVAWCA